MIVNDRRVSLSRSAVYELFRFVSNLTASSIESAEER